MKLITPKQAAEILGVTIYTLRNWNIAKKLTAVKTIGGHRRYKIEDVERLKNENET